MQHMQANGFVQRQHPAATAIIGCVSATHTPDSE